MATQKLQIYSCKICGNIVEVIHTGDGTLTCCREPMELFVENTTDAAQEKHVPVIEPVEGGIKATVGSVAHPMEPEHHIAWIEVLADGKAYRRFLEPGEPPEAVFPIEGDAVTVREYCNLHGLWKAS